jgi:molecular chaperone DnaK
LNDPIVGIDLGTSNSVVAHADAAGIVRVLADDSGAKVHPSVVSFHPNGGVVIGAAAKQRKVIDPQNTIYSVKRLIGRAFKSPEVQTAKTRSPFVIKEGPNNAPLIVTRGGEFAVPEISAIVLDHVRNVASSRLECPVNRAVVTVPASFNDAQRSATATAGAIAGLTVVRVLNEPTAAALAYGHTRQLREIIAVYDFGGGTFDITLLKLEDQVYEVLGTSGDTFLGGDDLDERLVDKMVAKFLAENRIDLRTNEVSMMRLRAVAEQTKIELSRRSRAVVRVDEIAYGARGAPLNLQIEIHRDEFVREVADLIDRTFPVCTEALNLAGLALDQIADVILVGGTTKIPYVRDQVGRFFGKLPRADVNPEDAVAAGAALQATSLERILSRRVSSKMAPAAAAIPAAPDEPTVTADVLELTDPASGATMAPSELTLATVERPKRSTSGYLDAPARPLNDPSKPDTSYSVTRAGVRDQVAEPERYPAGPAAAPPAIPPVPSAAPNAPASPRQTAQGAAAGFETRTPAPYNQTQPLGRITKPVGVPVVPPPVPAQNKTMLGVPAAPFEFEVELTSGGVTTAEPIPQPEPPPRLPTSAATPPPVPRGAAKPISRPVPVQSLQATAQLPSLQRAPDPPPSKRFPAETPATLPAVSGWLDVPDVPSPRSPAAAPPPSPPSALDGFGSEDWTMSDDSSAGTNPAAWLLPSPDTNPATTLPLSPTSPIAPATAQTMVAIAPDYAAASGSRGPHAQTLIADAAPATTARGFQAPQSFPIQQMPIAQMPVMPAMPMAMPVAPAPRPAPVVLEVTPRGLGIATVAGFCEELIRRNARLPSEMKKLFTTSRDHQDMVRIVVCQGESRRLENNTIIGDLVLQGLQRRPRGETSIEVTFSLDASGILNVRARDPQTGVEQRATLDLVGGVAQDDVVASRDRIQQLRR